MPFYKYIYFNISALFWEDMTRKEICGKKCTYFHCVLCLGVLCDVMVKNHFKISILTLPYIFSSNYVMCFIFYLQGPFGEWYRYFLFSVWVIDIVLIFLVYHLEKSLKEIIENFQRDRRQEEDYVNYGASSVACEQASWNNSCTAALMQRWQFKERSDAL